MNFIAIFGSLAIYFITIILLYEGYHSNPSKSIGFILIICVSSPSNQLVTEPIKS